MRYLSIFISQQPSKPIVVIDLLRPDRLSLIDGAYYADFHESWGYISNYRNILKAPFDRRADTGEIKAHDIPQRLNGTDLLARIEGLKQRGSDRCKRNMHPNSLANLRPAKRFSERHSPRKPRKLTDEQLDKAQELRRNGCSWRTVGDLLRCNAQTVRSSLRRRIEEEANSD